MKKPTYTVKNVEEAMRLYEEENGHAPNGGSGIVRHGSLANGTRTWDHVSRAFRDNVVLGLDKPIL